MKPYKSSRTARGRLLITAGVLLLAVASAHANETDQFTLPPDNNFADLAPDLTRWYCDVLQQGVMRANANIDLAIARGAPASGVANLQSVDSIVNSVDGVFQRGNDIVDAVEAQLRSSAMQRPGQRFFFREVYGDIYYHAFWIWDPRIISRFYFSSTIKAFGTYFGTDKLGHFSAIGISYYWSYRTALQAGCSQEQALAQAVANGTTGFQSEAGIMGLTTTGDYSNADLSANYAGFLFFRNLTENVSVHGKLLTPLLLRDGPHWKLSPLVRPDSDFFAPFVSDHWNEALNPGWFVESMRPTLRNAVLARTDNILLYYSIPGTPSTAEYFRDRRHSLQTYWSQDYGHRGTDAELIGIDNTCFTDALPLISSALKPNRLGNGPLHAGG